MGMRMKLLVDKETNKVVYGEAGKDVVDFLVGLLEIPVGCIMRLLSLNNKTQKLSLAKVCESVKSLDSSYFVKADLKTSTLNPRFITTSQVKQAPMLQSLIPRESTSIILRPYSYGSPSLNPVEVDGYVKGAVTYIVMEDLTITPSSTITSINLHNTLGIKNVGSLREKTVEIDATKALELVRASFQSSTVLTDVFVSPALSAKRQRR